MSAFSTSRATAAAPDLIDQRANVFGRDAIGDDRARKVEFDIQPDTILRARAHEVFDKVHAPARLEPVIIRVNIFRLDDDVIASTVLERFNGARAFYSTLINRGEEVLAEVQSSWCCIDAQTLRPARIGEHLREFFFPKGE